MSVGLLLSLSLLAYFAGVVIKRLIHPVVGDAVEVIAAIVIVIVILIGFIHA